jgi:hypothetical protein
MNITRFLIILLCFVSVVYAIEVKKTRIFPLIQNDKSFIKCPGSFFVTEDDHIFILDKKDSNIKIYDFKGNLINIFGRKGMGPDEFITPCYGTYKTPWVVFMDFGRGSCFLYKRSSIKILEFYEKYIEIGYINSYQVMNNEEILMAGDKRDNEGRLYSVSIYNHVSKKYEYLLPFEKSYEVNSVKEWMEKDRTKYIESDLFCDWLGDYIYHVWTGELKIMKLNRRTKKFSYFGKKTENYVQPYVTPEIKKAFLERKNNLYFSLGNTMSFVRYLFTMNSGHIGIIYTGRLKNNKYIPVMLQIYTSSGEFIKEFELLSAQASNYNELYYFFNKEKDLFYILDTETSKDFDQYYKIHEYGIN